MEIINVFNKIADSNLAYYLLVIILVIVVIAMIYLIYSQNKEIKEAQKNEELENKTDMIEELASDVKEEQTPKVEEAIDDNIDRTAKIPIHDSILQMVEEEPTYDNVDIKPFIGSKNIFDVPAMEVEEEPKIIEKRKIEPIELPIEPLIDEVKTPVIEENVEEIAKVTDMESIVLPAEKKRDILDATLTDIPRISLLDETMTDIPPVMDYLDDTQELIDLTKQLEQSPKKKTIELTPYEEEQEQAAIISYDELVDNKNKEEKPEVSIKQVDLEKVEEVKKVLPYNHEENFLAKLKSLQSKIN